MSILNAHFVLAVFYCLLIAISLRQTDAFSASVLPPPISSSPSLFRRSLIRLQRQPQALVMPSSGSFNQQSALFLTKTASLSPTTSLSGQPPLTLKPIHFVHPTFMSLGLASLSTLGLYYGLTIKWARRAAKKGEKKYTLQQVKQARDWHPKLMTAIMGLYGAGAIGGLVSMLTLEQPLLQSQHAKTAAFTFLLLLTQAGISKKLVGSPEYLKKVHSGIGMFTMLAMVTHGLAGLKLFGSLWSKATVSTPALVPAYAYIGDESS